MSKGDEAKRVGQGRATCVARLGWSQVMAGDLSASVFVRT